MSYFFLILLFCCYSQTDLLDEMIENVKISYSVYCQDKDIADWTCYFCNTTKEKYSHITCSGETKLYNNYFFAVQNEDTLVIVFRGSQPLKQGVPALINWILNLCFYYVQLPFAPLGVKVHGGFYKCYTDVIDDVKETIDKYLLLYPKIESILFTGHSLGSTITTLAIADISVTTENPRIIDMIINNRLRLMTFGCPRIGNRNWVEWFESVLNRNNNYRVTNQRDPVPTVPPYWIYYRHFPYEYFFENNTKEFKKCDGSGEDPLCGFKYFRDHVEDHLHYCGVDKNKGYDYGCV